MKFVKTMKYKIKHLIPMAAIAGATLLPAACNKTRHAPEQPHHNTTYVWGLNNWDAVNPKVTDNVAKSADSTLVDYVFLLNDGNSLAGISTSLVLKDMNTIVESVNPNKRPKVRGAGKLHETSISSQKDIQDSIKLSQFGFSFGRVVYGPGFQR